MKKILMIIAQHGFRDEELMVPKEVFEKAGMQVRVASRTRTKASGSRGAQIMPDLSVHEANPEYFDAIVVVGGPGSALLARDQEVLGLLRKADEKGKVLGAICLGPMALACAGILSGKNATVFPEKEALRALKDSGAFYLEKAVVRSGRVVTAGGPDASGEFAESILKALEES